MNSNYRRRIIHRVYNSGVTMFGVIGATGNVGSVVVRELLHSGESVVAVSPSGGPSAPRLRHAIADVREPHGLTEALRGATAIFLLVAVEAHDGVGAKTLVAAIEATGAERLVLLSSIGVLSRPEAPGYDHLRHLEDATAGSRLATTILRPTGFASNSFAWIASIRAQRQVAAPFPDVRVPIVDPADVGAVAAATLRSAQHAGAIYELTGPAAISPREQTSAIADALGAAITFHELTREQAATSMRQFMPDALAQATLDILGTPTAHERRVSPDTERILARAPTSYASWVKRNVEAFR